jgi:hypothetical protein
MSAKGINSTCNNRTPKPVNDKKNDKKVTCFEHILAILKKTNHALNYLDFGEQFSYGSLRNVMSKLVKHGKVIRLPKECPTRFILPQWAHRPEYYYVQRKNKKGRVGKFDFLSYLESLSWEPVLGVHDLKLCFMVYQFHWFKNGWSFSKNSRSYSRRFVLSYPVSVQCFDTGTVMVSIKCSSRPFPFNLEGLISLSILLGEVRDRLRASCIPDPVGWRVIQWHLNRDSQQISGGGSDVYLTFRDFFEDSSQFYYKHNLEKYRAEVSQSPKRSLKEVFENILNRDDYQKKGGPNCS